MSASPRCDSNVRRLLFATGNAHKVSEVAEILGAGWVVEARDPRVEETGLTFEENAVLKARAIVDATGSVAVAEDSGIIVDGLGLDPVIGGRPGIHSARWTEESDWIPRVLRGLEPGVDRSARYVAAAALVLPDGTVEVRRGTVEGAVASGPRGHKGFGYDPIFVPAEGDGRTFGEMDEAAKHALSHRGRAFRLLLPVLDATVPQD